MTDFDNNGLNAAWGGLLVAVLEWQELLERLSSGSDDGPTGAEAGGENVSSHLGSCLAFELSEVEGWG
jgi:hypothetical protein